MTIRARLRSGAILALGGIAGVGASSPAAGDVVLELFTSQGCSNCPAADALLADYAGRDGVVALSLAVDYWNYLGWEDTLASRDHTERQWAYAAARGENQVYTPQIVVDGRADVVGSDREALDAAIAAAAATPDVPLTLMYSDGAVQIDIAAEDGAPMRGTIWLVLFDQSETVSIGRGENAGRTVTYHNVVRRMNRIGMWRGEAMSIELSAAVMAEAGADGCAVLIQEEMPGGTPGAIIGAAALQM